MVKTVPKKRLPVTKTKIDKLDKLKFLLSHIDTCHECGLRKNGIALPYFNENKLGKYAILGEAPGEEEVSACDPFVGSSGKLLFKSLRDFDFKRSDFLILNSVQCRPVARHNKNGKPSLEQLVECGPWVDRFISVYKPKVLLALGNYGAYHIRGKLGGIMYLNGSTTFWRGMKVIYCIHPASVLYHRDNLSKFRSALTSFRRECDANT